MFAWRGGAFSADATNSNNATVEEYVAAMKEKDGQDRTHEEKDEELPSDNSNSHHSSTEESSSSSATDEGGENSDSAVVGVKSHSHKKSNACGDPDGDDDDDTTDSSLSEYSEEWEELEDFDDFVEDLIVEPQMQVEVELVEEGGSETEEQMPTSTAGGGGGGVGVRLGRMNSRRKNRKDTCKSTTTKLSHNQDRLLEAWMPHIYFPPTSTALAYLSDNARLLDASSKSRLDRRSLYAGLLLEWGCTDSKLSSRTRKFLPSSTSQALQAALSMATQPKWRQPTPRTSGIRLFQDEENSKASTLAMQETIAMALVSRKQSKKVSKLNVLELELTNQISTPFTGTLSWVWNVDFGRPSFE